MHLISFDGSLVGLDFFLLHLGILAGLLLTHLVFLRDDSVTFLVHGCALVLAIIFREPTGRAFRRRVVLSLKWRYLGPKCRFLR